MSSTHAVSQDTGKLLYFFEEGIFYEIQEQIVANAFVFPVDFLSLYEKGRESL